MTGHRSSESPDQLSLWESGMAAPPVREVTARETPRPPPTDADPAPLSPPGPLSVATRVSAAIPPFLDFCASIDRSRHTRESLRTDLVLLERFLGDPPVGEISLEDLRRYVAWLGGERGNDSRSLRRKIASVKGLYRWLASQEIVRENPAARLVYPALQPSPPEILEDAEAERLLAVAERPLWRAVLLTLLDCGLKRDELLALHPADVYLDPENDEKSSLTIRATKDAHRVRARTLRLSPRLAECLRGYLAATPGDLAFPISVRMVNAIVEICGERSGVRKRGTISPQMLRDTFAAGEVRRRAAVEESRRHQGASPAELTLLRQQHDAEVTDLLGLTPGPLNDPIARYRLLVAR